TYLAGRPRNSKQLLSRSTTGPGKLSAGVRPRKYLPSSYDYFNSPVLHRPVELTVYTSLTSRVRCTELGVAQSMVAVGTSADNALQCRQEVFRWCIRYNTRRRHSWCG